MSCANKTPVQNCNDLQLLPVHNLYKIPITLVLICLLVLYDKSCCILEKRPSRFSKPGRSLWMKNSLGVDFLIFLTLRVEMMSRC